MSERYLCLNCWRTPAREEAFYLCPECSSGGDLPGWAPRRAGSLRQVRELRPPWSHRLFAGETEDFHCPRHPSEALLLYCHCERPLSAGSAFEYGSSLGLGFAGPRSSGKTLLTITMVNRLHGLDISSRRIGISPLDSSEERFHELSARLLEQGYKPEATAPEDPAAEGRALEVDASRNFAWKIFVDEPGRRPVQPMFLAVYDVAGETWGMPQHERRGRFDRYLGLIGSLVFLIDGAAVAADLGYKGSDAWDPEPRSREGGWTDRQWLPRILERLGKQARKVDVALVLSKADYLWDLPEWTDLRPDPKRNREHARQTLEQILLRTQRNDLLITARASFRNVDLFAVSSLGFHPGPGDVDRKGRLKPHRRHLEPVGVTEPLSWLLQLRLGSLR